MTKYVFVGNIANGPLRQGAREDEEMDGGRMGPHFRCRISCWTSWSSFCHQDSVGTQL